MKLFGFVLVALSLVAGLVGAGSAYLVRVDRGADELLGLTVNEAVVVSLVSLDEGTDPLATRVLVPKGTVLAADHLQQLAQAEVTHVRVEEFAFGRWEGKFLFLGGVLGLGVGALLVRLGARMALDAEPAENERGPAEVLAQIRGAVDGVRGAVARHADGPELLGLLSPIVDDLLPAFPAGRDRMVARMGLGAYAQVMDSFAAGERQLHRAWSAAADDVLDETAECVERAAALFDQTRAELAARLAAHGAKS